MAKVNAFSAANAFFMVNGWVPRDFFSGNSMPSFFSHFLSPISNIYDYWQKIFKAIGKKNLFSIGNKELSIILIFMIIQKCLSIYFSMRVAMIQCDM